MKNKFVITGGHHNSALVVAEEILRRGDEVIWFGHRFAAKNDKNDSAEYLEVTAKNIPFIDLKAGKLGSDSSISVLWSIPLGIIRAGKLLQVHNPSAVISFGGYLGFAVSLAAYFKKIPIFLHEQTVVAGKANKLISRLAKKVYLTWSSSLAHLPRGIKAQVVGLPLRSNILIKTRKKAFANGLPTILVLGGKQGSHIINTKIFANLDKLLSRYNLIHQTGTSTATGDYEKALSLKNTLSEDMTERYRPVGYLVENEIGAVLDQADVVVGRSGAHITYELGIKGKKSVLIPYLLTHDKEQFKNARLLESQGLAEIISESELSFPKLLNAITKMLRKRNVEPISLPTDADKVMCEDINNILKGQ